MNTPEVGKLFPPKGGRGRTTSASTENDGTLIDRGEDAAYDQADTLNTLA